MIPLSSPHVHTPFCDGRSTVEEMVSAALSLGFVSLGFSSHARQDFDMDYAMDAARESAYIQAVRKARQAYAGQLRIWLGMERDRLSTAERTPYDYVIGSVHYLCHDGQYQAVDGRPEDLQQWVARHYAGSGLALARAYYAQLGQYIQQYRPDIIGHFDIVGKNNTHGQLFDAASPAYLALAYEAMQQAIQGCTLLEVNTGGMARYGHPQPYPSLPLLRYWRRLGGQVILSSDCHLAQDLAFGYKNGLALIRRAGYDQLSYLGAGDQLLESAAL